MTRTIKRGDGFVTSRPQKDGTVRWQARWQESDSWRAKTFDTQDDAEDHLRSVGRAKRGGRYVPESKVTVSELVREYIDRGRSRWSSNTYASYRQILDGVITPGIGSRRAVELTPRMVQHWIDGLGKTYSPARIEVIRAVLSGAMKEAVMMDVLPRSPTTGVRGPQVRRSTKATWSAQEAARLLESVREDADAYAFYTVALTTGMRPGEMRALMWRDIDAARRMLTVQRSTSRDEEYRPIIGAGTKTGRSRTIALPDETLAALAAHRRKQAERQLRAAVWHDLGLVFPRGDGRVATQQTIAKRHARLCERAGVPVITLHALRHTAATLLMEAGVHVKVVSDMLGHSKIATTLDIYSHTSESMQRSAAESLGSVLGLDKHG